MAYYTNKKASNLGLAGKAGAATAARIIAPNETFKADAEEIPRPWLDLGWMVLASKEDEAMAKDRDAQADKGGVVNVDQSNPLNTQGDVPPAPAPGSPEAEKQAAAQPAESSEGHSSSRRNR